MGLPISSSVIVTRALGLEPEGVPAIQQAVCSLCGLAIQPGELHTPFGVGHAFTDDASLACRGSGHTCGFCAPLLSASGLMKSGFGVFSAQGVRPFRKWADIADALMNPPEPPFVMLYATANNQHMAWRAPVNYSRDAFRVRVGLRDLLIRKGVVQEAFEACRVLGTAPGIATASTGTRKTLPNPFAFLSSDLKDIEHGRLSARLMSEAFLSSKGEKEQSALNLIKALTLGETWALRFVLTPNAGKTTA